MKPNCYECKHRSEAPGSCHSQCQHPAFSGVNAAFGLLAMLRASQRGGPIEARSGEITVRGNQHGIDNGWFMHPLNFDPVWLEECNGFESRNASTAVSGVVSQVE